MLTVETGVQMARVHSGRVALADDSGQPTVVVDVNGGWVLTPLGYERLTHRLASLQVQLADATAKQARCVAPAAVAPPAPHLSHQGVLLVAVVVLLVGLAAGLLLGRR